MLQQASHNSLQDCFQATLIVQAFSVCWIDIYLCDGHYKHCLYYPETTCYHVGSMYQGRQAVGIIIIYLESHIVPLFALQYFHIIFGHDAIYFAKCTSPSCSKTTPQHDAGSLIFHSGDGVLRLLRQASPNLVQMQRWSLWPKSSISVWSDDRTCLHKLRSFSLCAFANCNLAFFNVSFKVMASSWESGYPPSEDSEDRPSEDNNTLQHLHQIFVVLGLLCWVVILVYVNL